MKYARALNRFNYIKKFIKKTYNLNVLEIGASDGLLLSPIYISATLRIPCL